MRCLQRLRLWTALPIALSLGGCATTDLADARRREALAPEVTAAYERGLADGRDAAMPAPLPARCRRTERIGAKNGDRLDVVAARADAALGRANLTITSCATWHDAERAAKAGA